MMINGMSVSQREIILIPFPYTDLSSTKNRPGLVISTREFNSKNEDIICCAITSNPRNYHNSVELKKSDLESGQLRYDCVAKPHKIFTLNQCNIIKKLAKLNISKSKDVVEKLNISIEIEE